MFPGLASFFSLWFALTVIHESRRAAMDEEWALGAAAHVIVTTRQYALLTHILGDCRTLWGEHERAAQWFGNVEQGQN